MANDDQPKMDLAWHATAAVATLASGLVAEKVVADLGLSGKVQVGKTSCLGDCAGAPVLEFRGQVSPVITRVPYLLYR